MKPTKQSVLDAAQQLSPEEQLEVAAALRERAMPFFEDAEVEAVWAEEIKSRLNEIDQGKVELIPGDEVMEEIRKLVDDRAE